MLGLILPLSLLISNYIFILAIIVLIFYSPKRSKIRWRALLILLIPALIPLLSGFFHNETFSFVAFDVKIPFIVTALLIGFTKVNDDLLSKFKMGFVVGALIGGALALLDSSAMVVFMKSSLFLDISYIPLYTVIALIFIWFTDIPIKPIFKLAFSISFILILFLLKNTFFTTSGALVLFSAVIVKGSPLQSRLAIGVLIILFSIFIYRGNDIQKRLHAHNQTEMVDGVDKLAQWQCVLEVMQNNELFGVGYSSKDILLQSCYHKNLMFEAENNRLNSHNEYLDAFLTLGYLGVLGLLVYFFKLMFVAYDNKQVANLLIVILIALFSITENVFTRQKGVMITSITCLLIFSSKSTKPDEASESNLTL